MATPAQILANRANAQLSTGPTTAACKAAVSQNATPFGVFLPHENPEEFAALLASLEDEHAPETPTEKFLVTEMARAQWKLARIEAMEAAVFVSASITELLNKPNNLPMQLDRYAASARRAWHKALDALVKYRAAVAADDVRYSRVRRNLAQAEVNEIMAAPLPSVPCRAPQPEYKSKPIPADLALELDRHMRRDHLFDPKNDASQMSKRLRKWFEQAAAAA